MRSAITAFILIVIGSTAASAQNRWPISVEFNAGPSLGRTIGEYRDYGSGLAIDGLLAYRVSPGTDGGLVLGFSSSIQGPGPVTSICIPAQGGGCVPHFPTFGSGAVLAGYETGVSWTVRGLLGPAYVRADESTFGFQGRADIAVPVVSRISLALSGRALLIPSYRGEQFDLYAFGLGLRIR